MIGKRVRASPLARGAALRRLCEGPGCRACSAALAAGPAGAPPSGGAGAGEAKRVGVAVVDDDDEVRRVVLGVVTRRIRSCVAAASPQRRRPSRRFPGCPCILCWSVFAFRTFAASSPLGTFGCSGPASHCPHDPGRVDESILGRATAAGADKCCQKPLDGRRCLGLLRSAAGDLAAARVGLLLTAREQEALACRARGLPWKAIPRRWALAGGLRRNCSRVSTSSLASRRAWPPSANGVNCAGRASWRGGEQGRRRPSKRQQ